MVRWICYLTVNQTNEILTVKNHKKIVHVQQFAAECIWIFWFLAMVMKNNWILSIPKHFLAKKSKNTKKTLKSVTNCDDKNVNRITQGFLNSKTQIYWNSICVARTNLQQERVFPKGKTSQLSHKHYLHKQIFYPAAILNHGEIVTLSH